MKTILSSLLALALLVPSAAAASSGFGRDVANVARHYRDARPELSMATCNGLVLDIFRDVGTPVRGNVRMLYADMRAKGWVHQRKVPAVGDVVFFDSTYDRNRNGKQDDPLSHIAVVISVDSDGTVHMVHHGSRGITPLTLNLHHPSTRRSTEGKALNSWLGASGYARDGHRLAGELWRGFATPQPDGRAVVAARPAPRSRITAAAPTGDLPVGLDDAALRRVWEGDRVRRRHLADRSCLELWFLRNAVYASHGFDFSQPAARAYFGQISTYRPDSRVDASVVQERLTRRDRKNVEAVFEAERSGQCR